MDWTRAQKNDNGVVIPEKWLHLHYYEALTVLFRFENALRVFVYIVLKNARKGKWRDLQISSDDGTESTVSAIAKRRLAQDERFGYLGYRITSPLMHLTSGELIRLIFIDAYWPLFADYFPAGREIVRTKLEEVGNIRNALAHFRPIKKDDVEVVKQNANQVLARVENAIGNVLRTESAVPSNTSDAWYSALKQVAGQYNTVSFQQSENEQWIQVQLVYNSQTVGRSSLGTDYGSWRALTIQTPAVLKRAPSVLENVIFASEEVPDFDTTVNPLRIRKVIQLLFSRQTLSEAYDAIKADLDTVVSLITTETDLIREDNLARGDIVRVATVTASKHGHYWSRSTGAMNSKLSEDDPAEFWGTTPGYGIDFVTDTPSYPWMPVDVADIEQVPF